MSKRPSYPNPKKTLLSNYQIKECKEVFDILDKNKTGVISTDDIIKIKNIFLYPISCKNIQEMIKEIDIYGEGKFDFRKFITLFQKQIEYIDDIDEETFLKSLKEDFGLKLLGKKRKRLAQDKYEEEKKENNFVTPKIIENEDSIDETNTKREEGIDDGSSFTSDINWNNNKKRKIENENIIDFQIGNEKNVILEKNNNKIIIDNSSEMPNDYGKDINCNYSKKSKRNDKMKCKNNIRKYSENKKNKIDIDIIDYNTIIIYKKYLSNYIIEQIEQTNNNNIENQNNNEKKDNYFPLIHLENNEDDNMNNNINNNFQLQKPISSFCSSNINSEDEFNNNCNSNENSFSFSSDCNSFNKAFLLNSFLDKSPALSYSKLNLDVEDDLPIFGSERVIYESKDKKIDKDINKSVDIKVNKKKNNIQNHQKRRNLANSEININVYDSTRKYFGKNEKEKKRQKERQKEITKYKKYQYQDKDTDTTIISYNNNKNIQILNTLILEYKRNRKKERIIKKCIEIPYLIIIEKTALNMKEIQKYLNKYKKISEKSLNMRKNKEKMNNTEISSTTDIFCYDNLNKTFVKNESYFNNSFLRSNDKRKKGKKKEDEFKSKTAEKDNIRYNKYKERKVKDKKKNINYTKNYYNNYTLYDYQNKLNYDKKNIVESVF
jgi:hypothetical protein